MAYRVQLAYFRLTGKFLAFANVVIERKSITEIWDAIHELRSMGRLPGLRANSGRDLFILVDVVDHPQRVLHVVMPPFVNEEDVTPIRVPTGEVRPIIRIPLEEMSSPRTTTHDVIRIEPGAEDDGGDTPVDRPSLLKLDKPS
jgi:hypothetical protein